MLIYKNYDELPDDLTVVKGMQEIEGDQKAFHAVIKPDVVYAIKGGKELHLRIMKPERTATKERYPLLLFVQGSAWGKQDLNATLLPLVHLVRRGYIVAMTEYRESSIAPFPAQICDTKTAMRFLMSHKEEYDIDETNIFLGGDSSGGHTALACWATWNSPQLDEEQTTLWPLNAVIDFYGPFDLFTISEYPSTIVHDACDSPEGLLLGHHNPKGHPAIAGKANIIYYMRTGMQAAPLLILHGSKDTLVPFHQSVELFETAKNMGCDVTFYKIRGADHGGSRFFCAATDGVVQSFLEDHRK